MSSQIVPSAIQYHNQQPLEYFADKVKKTMIPVESNDVLRHVNGFVSVSGITAEEKLLEVGYGMGKVALAQPQVSISRQITDYCAGRLGAGG